MKFTMAIAIAALGMAGAAQAQSGTYAYASTGESNGYGGYSNNQGETEGARVLTGAQASAADAAWGNAVINGSAAASADLATGKLRASADANRLAIGTNAFATADAYLADILNFTVAGATAQTVTPIAIEFTSHGTTSLGYGSLYHATSEFHLGAAGFSIVRSQSDNNVPYFFFNPANWASASMENLGDTQRVFLTFNLSGASQSYSTFSRLQALTAGDASADFSNTTSIRFILPETVTMTSASGVFLSQVTSAVPEPSTWALLILGFGVTGAALRRRRATSAFA